MMMKTVHSFIILALCGFATPLAGQAQDARSLVESVYTTSVRGTVADLTIDATASDPEGIQPLRIFIKGSNKIRYERGSSTDLRVTIYNANQGWVISGSRVEALPAHVSVQRPTLIPSLDLIAEYENPRLVAADRGMVVRGAQSAQLLSLSLPDSVERRPFGKKLDEALDVFVDPATLLVIRTERLVRAAESIDAMIPSGMEFSDYRLVGGVYVPFRILLASGAAGAGKSEILISNVAVNTNLPDSLFVPPGGER